MRALITGITGQDGSYLAELLLEKGYEVVGITRGRASHANIAAIEDRITLVTGDITDRRFVDELLKSTHVTEIYNLASVATVLRPWEDVHALVEAAALAPLHFLEGIREHSPETRFFQASSAEMFGNPAQSPQDEHTELRPVRPYGIAKALAHNFVGAYRKQHGIGVVSGILFNHESPRRGHEFITRKITHALASIKLGRIKEFSCGNLDAKRDWGYAKEYVEAMWLMLQQDEPRDYVIATGEVHSVREVIEVAARTLGMEITWEGKGIEEVGRDSEGRTLVRVEEKWYRATEPVELTGDASLAKKNLGWEPQTSFSELIQMMAEEDLRRLETTIHE